MRAWRTLFIVVGLGALDIAALWPASGDIRRYPAGPGVTFLIAVACWFAVAGLLRPSWSAPAVTAATGAIAAMYVGGYFPLALLASLFDGRFQAGAVARLLLELGDALYLSLFVVAMRVYLWGRESRRADLMFLLTAGVLVLLGTTALAVPMLHRVDLLVRDSPSGNPFLVVARLGMLAAALAFTQRGSVAPASQRVRNRLGWATFGGGAAPALVTFVALIEAARDPGDPAVGGAFVMAVFLGGLLWAVVFATPLLCRVDTSAPPAVGVSGRHLLFVAAALHIGLALAAVPLINAQHRRRGALNPVDLADVRIDHQVLAHLLTQARPALDSYARAIPGLVRLNISGDQTFWLASPIEATMDRELQRHGPRSVLRPGHGQQWLATTRDGFPGRSSVSWTAVLRARVDDYHVALFMHDEARPDTAVPRLLATVAALKGGSSGR